MIFNNPEFLWLFFILPLLFVWRRKFCNHPKFRFPQTHVFRGLKNNSKPTSQKFLNLLRYSALVFAILALARPQLINKAQEISSNGIDIMLAVDVSSSMMGLDFYTKNDRKLTTRLDVAKSVLSEFITHRHHDRLGIVAFARNPYLVSPTTLNREWLIKNLKRLHIGIIEDGTAIGDGIAMCCNRLKSSTAKSKVIILLTDGIQNSGKLTPITAAEVAATLGIKIYTVGIGKNGIVPIGVPDQEGNISYDVFGNPLIAKAQLTIDEDVLKKIANITQGKYFHATDKVQLNAVYDTINALEKTEIKINQLATAVDLYAWFCFVALLLALLERFLSNTKWRVLP